MSNRRLVAVIVLGMLAAAAVVKAPVRGLDPVGTLHKLASEQVAELDSSIWASWSAVPSAPVDSPRVRNPEKKWIGPVRTPWTRVAVVGVSAYAGEASVEPEPAQ